MSPLAGMKHTYVRLAIVIFSHFLFAQYVIFRRLSSNATMEEI